MSNAYIWLYFLSIYIILELLSYFTFNYMSDQIDTNNINKETFQRALKLREVRKEPLVLIVDDQKFSRDLLRAAIAGHSKLVFAESGENALVSYIKNAPDIVFLDIELPGIGGHKVLELLLKLDPGAFIVMVTANNYPEDVTKALKNGAKGFIAKPFNKQKITQTMELYWSERKKKGV